ncbi:hypothetical protein [Duganella sp. BuS-21]|uniref:hypothetical protein n=1 Tax=Duganella sp. BuS-21 TaxID=2943848 RepID=UPI0035A71E3B
MKKLPDHDLEVAPNSGKPPKHLAVKRVQAHEIDPELYRAPVKISAFKETTPEDFDRIIAEFQHELGKV